MVLNIPRTGDDALIYLWKGAFSRQGYDRNLPAVRDILEQRYLRDDPPESIAKMRVRVTGKVAGSPIPLYDLLVMRPALALGLPLKWTFAVTEVLGLVCMTAAFAGFLRTLVGDGAAGVGLLLLAFAILPAQGIFSFIPSTLALSLGMLLWTVLLSHPARMLVPVTWGLALLAVGLHPMGIIYVLMAMALHATTLGGVRGVMRRQVLWLHGGLLGAVILSLAVGHLVPALAPPQPGALGQIDLARGVAGNLAGVARAVLDPLLRKNALLLGLLACGLALTPRRLLAGRVKGVLIVCGAFMVASLLHVFPGHPGEMFLRLLVPAVVVAAGMAGRFVIGSWGPGGARWVPGVALAVGLAIGAGLWVDYLFHEMNLRPEVVWDARVHAQLDRLPRGTSILYGETEISLLASLLNGGDRFGALAFPMLARTASLTALVQARQPPVAVVPALRSLNTLAAQRMKNFIPRRHGFYFGAVDQITVRLPGDKTFSDLYVYAVNGGPAFTLSVSVSGMPGTGRTPKGGVRVPKRFEGWLRVWDLQMQGATEVMLRLPNVWGWIEGIATEVPETHVRWPWKSGAVVTYHVRGKALEKGGSIQFTVEHLLGEYAAAALVPLVQMSAPVISDDSGLVFLRTIFAKKGP